MYIKNQPIYKNLQIEMLRANMTQSDIALKMGITPTTFTNKMRGKTTFTLPEALKIQEVINKELKADYTLDYLFKN